jgi:hypothetical protein
MSPIEKKRDAAKSQSRRKDSGRKSAEDVNRAKDASESDSKRRVSNSGDTELPPNKNLGKDPDEAYGDTEIPHRNSEK